MTEPQTLSAYFTYCKLQKNLDNKTLKAYQIDLKQFVAFYPKPATVTRTDMELYIEHLMEHYKASTVKRKIAALKAYYHYLVYEEILEHSPFEKIQLHIRQEILLPRTIAPPATCLTGYPVRTSCRLSSVPAFLLSHRSSFHAP